MKQRVKPGGLGWLVIGMVASTTGCALHSQHFPHGIPGTVSEGVSAPVVGDPMRNADTPIPTGLPISTTARRADVSYSSGNAAEPWISEIGVSNDPLSPTPFPLTRGTGTFATGCECWIDPIHQSPAWTRDHFVNAEAALVFPRWSGLFVAPVPLADDEDVVSAVVRNSRLNATVSPWLQLGFFRFGSGYGELVFDYRFLASEGSQTVPLLETEDALRLRSRLNLQTFGIDYVRNDIELPCGATVNWNLGGYLQVVFFDTQSYVEDLFQHVSNYFFGAGPRFGVGLTQPLTPGLSLFAHGNAAWMVGYNVTQNFTVEINDPENGVLSGELDRERSIGSPWWAARTGLTWTPARWPTARFQGGYQFEQWYRLGRIGDSRGDLSAHGIFINWELDF